MYLAIFGGRWRISVKWEIKTFSTSFSVPTSASASNFTSLRQLAASLLNPTLSGKLASQSLQIRPLAKLLKKKSYCVSRIAYCVLQFTQWVKTGWRPISLSKDNWNNISKQSVFPPSLASCKNCRKLSKSLGCGS